MKYSQEEIDYLEHKQAPELEERVTPSSWFYWQAFHHLRGSRQEGVIPFLAISNYSEWLGQTCPIEKGQLVKMVMAMDNAERDHHGRTSS